METEKTTFMQKVINLVGLSKSRQLTGWSKIFFTVVSLCFCLLFLYCAGPAFLGRVPIQYHRGLYVMLMSIMVFIKYPFSSKSPMNRVTALDLLMIVLSILVFGFWIVKFEYLLLNVGMWKAWEYYIAIVGVLICLEVSRRVLGPAFPLVAIIFILYAMYGNVSWMPRLLKIKGFNLNFVAAYCFSLEGIFGTILYTIATFVTLFVIFGALMESLGAGDFFIGLPYALTCGRVGGPAKTAVLASALFGSISGSATANTAATGSFTIPMMKKTGYPPEIAGAIEPAASTGGMFMPPVMGAGAFIMAEMLGLSYGYIITIAFIPALIYFASVYMIVHNYAKANDIPVIPKSERPDPIKIFKEGFFYFIPLIVLIVLLVSGYSAQRSIYWVIMLMILVCFISSIFKRDGLTIKESLKKFGVNLFEGIVGGGPASLTIGAVAGTTGIVVGVVMLTGLGFSFTTAVMSASQGILILAIGLSFLAAYVLGMGLTVTAAYILCATLAASSLIELGMTPIAAHFLLFWYSQTSNISPPVCLAAFVGAGIAQAHPYKCGFNALRFSAFLLIEPLLFAYSEMLFPHGVTFNAIWACFGCFCAIFPYAGGVVGYYNGKIKWPIRILLLGTTILFVIPNVPTTLAAIAISLVVYYFVPRLKNKWLVEV